VQDDDNIIFDRKPDRTEIIIRSVCGLVAGAAISSYLLFRWGVQSFGISLLVVLFASLLCSWLAAKHGDEFWCQLLGDRSR
jgi:hypothetical protein